MDKTEYLSNIPSSVIQTIYKCLSEAVGEDYQEAESHLNLETHISKPFLIWDLTYRNLINAFSDGNVLYSTKKQGMWEIMLLYDKNSKLLFSFMKDTRFRTIRQSKRGKQPQYIRAVLTLNAKLQAKVKQQRMFDDNLEDTSEITLLLDNLCMNFTEQVLNEAQHHALIVFSTSFGRITSLQANILDRNLDVVEERDWLDTTKPVMSNEVETTDKGNVANNQPILTDKAKRRLEQKELVELKSTEKDAVLS